MASLTAHYGQIAHIFTLLLRCVLWLIVARGVWEFTFHWRYPPNIPTSRTLRRAIVAALRQAEAARPAGAGAMSIVDLGSGNGRLSWHIARALPQAKVTGIDVSHTGNFLSRLRQHMFGPANLIYRRTNFMTADLSEVDAVVTYLGNRPMALIRDKLRAELKPGALVLSNTFPLGGDWQPVEVRTFRKLNQTTLLVYRQG